jgi:hypothetical protein
LGGSSYLLLRPGLLTRQKYSGQIDA